MKRNINEVYIAFSSSVSGKNSTANVGTYTINGTNGAHVFDHQANHAKKNKAAAAKPSLPVILLITSTGAPSFPRYSNRKNAVVERMFNTNTVINILFDNALDLEANNLKVKTNNISIIAIIKG